jgi:peroxin-4
MRAIGVMLMQPNADSPLNCDAGNLIRAGDLVGYSQLAEYYTDKYAICKKQFALNIQDKNENEKKN